MFEVKFDELGAVQESQYTRVVVVCRHQGKWVFSRKKGKTTWEIPGGHIEDGESWLDAAKREMFEETGAIDVDIKPICVYSISKYGLLCFGEIKEIGQLPDFEIEEIQHFDALPKELSYPETHNKMFEKVLNTMKD